jgi:hypothetical protein
MRTKRSRDGDRVLLTHVEPTGGPDGQPRCCQGIESPMIVRPEEVAGIRSGHSDQAFITLKSGREYEVRAGLDELERAVWGGPILAELWDGERADDAAEGDDRD